jgi:hypothetical protein
MPKKSKVISTPAGAKIVNQMSKTFNATTRVGSIRQAPNSGKNMYEVR